MGKGLSCKIIVQSRRTTSVFIRFPLAISTSKAVFSLEGSTLSKGANLVDTKLLSAPESNKILALCWFIKNVPVTTSGFDGASYSLIT